MTLIFENSPETPTMDKKGFGRKKHKGNRCLFPNVHVKKKNAWPGMMVHAFSPRTWETEQRQVDLCRFKPKLVYTVNSKANRGDSVFS